MTDDLKAPERPMWCEACRSTGAFHCAHPDECGNMLSAAGAADNWKAWLDDIPLNSIFDPAICRLQDFISALVARIATLEAALADMTRQRDAAMAGAVRVKPLVFSPWSGGGCMGSPQPFQFFITQMQDQNGDFLCHWDSSTYKTLDEAKAHAQACYLPPDPDRLLALTAAAAEAQAEARGMRKAADRAQEIANAAREVWLTLKMGSKAQIEIMERCWGAEAARMAITTLADATEAAAKGGV